MSAPFSHPQGPVPQIYAEPPNSDIKVLVTVDFMMSTEHSSKVPILLSAKMGHMDLH